MNQSEVGLAIPVATTTVPVKRILGRNPGPMTGAGTNSYLIGKDRLALLDPGPRDALQLRSFLEAITGVRLEYILVTHTHGDHSPGALALQEATGAKLVGLPAPQQVAGQDKTFVPDRLCRDGDIIDCGEFSLQLIATPGHVSNHICFLLREEQLLFTGDHVLQGTTSVILPPDGDMEAYLDALNRLLKLPLKALAPGHGSIMDEPQAKIKALIAHRLRREQKVLAALHTLGPSTLDALAPSVYDDVIAHLIPWAKKTLLAHLIKLERDQEVFQEGEIWQLR